MKYSELYEFDDLPLYFENDGFHYGYVSGQATIAFDEIGNWQIEDVFIETSRFDPTTGRWEHKTSQVNSNTGAYLRIKNSLNRESREIEEFVIEKITDFGSPYHFHDEKLTSFDLGVGRFS